MRSEAAARFVGVSRVYRTPTGEVRALRDVTAELPNGGISVIVGPSGSGKSSLLRLLAALDRPTDGTVTVMGVEIGRAGSRTRRSVRRTTVGYVYQRPSDNMLAHLTLGQHLRSAARSGGSLGDEARATADALGLTARLDHRPTELSGGEQQRAAVAQALASGARVVVADEPTAELDSDAAEAVLARIAELAARGVTFVLATHDRSVMSIADHRLTLEHGVVAGASSAGVATLDEGAAVPLRWPDATPDWAEPGEPALRLADVSKAYGDHEPRIRALDHVSLDVHPGSIVGLVGRSGSGKTTLLNVAAGWDRPDVGTIDRPGGDDPGWGDVAVVPQHLGLMDELTVRENVEYPARLRGDLAERRELVDDLLSRLGLGALQHRSPTETSLGEQQRTAVARAAVLRPTLIVADEPTAHQDAGWAAAVLGTLEDAVIAGSACVVATHDHDVLATVDRVVRIADGRLADEPDADGSPT